MLDARFAAVFGGDLEGADQRSLIVTVSLDWTLWGRSVRFPILRAGESLVFAFSFCLGEPLNASARLGNFVGDGVRGEACVAWASWFALLVDNGVDGESKVALARRAFKSDSELRRFFFRDFSAASDAAGGDCPIVLNLLGV
jgi:hypothetical protein